MWAFGVLALLFAWYKAMYVNRQDPGTERMAEIASYIREGAIAFLKREYSVLAVFAISVAILLFVANYANGTHLVGVSFLVGATCSGLAGVFGMRVATRANVRAANAARKGLAGALNVAFSGGSVMGMCVVGLGVLGLSTLFLAYSRLFGTELDIMQNQVLQVLSGFSLGASSIALFARVGGGIYTKSADVGADLVGKVEAGIPEDDPRNPAVIADLVGDNVGETFAEWAPTSSSPTSEPSSAVWFWDCPLRPALVTWDLHSTTSLFPWSSRQPALSVPLRALSS
jgi:K(+)-stimulated pyrophosphate-energized sodium pump